MLSIYIYRKQIDKKGKERKNYVCNERKMKEILQRLGIEKRIMAVLTENVWNGNVLTSTSPITGEVIGEVVQGTVEDYEK